MKRLWHVLVLLCILAGLLTVSALAETDPAALETSIAVFEPEPAASLVFGTVPDLTEPAAQVYDDPDAAVLLAETPTYSTMEEAVNAIKTGLANHVAQIQFYLSDDLVGNFNNRDKSEVIARLSSLRETLWTSAVAHNPAQPWAGDFWVYQMGIEKKFSYGYIISGSNIRYTLYLFNFTPNYYTTANQETAVTTELDSLMPTLVHDGMSDYEKVKAIYDYICETVTYVSDERLYDKADLLKYTAYAALIQNEAVCQGYAVLLYRMLLEAGIDCRVVTGTGYNGEAWGEHAWNIVKLDGKYYYLDATWDAGKAPENYDYFLRGSNSFSGHTPDEESAFVSAYPLSETDYDPSAFTAVYNFDTGLLTLTGGSLPTLAAAYDPDGRLLGAAFVSGKTSVELPDHAATVKLFWLDGSYVPTRDAELAYPPAA